MADDVPAIVPPETMDAEGTPPEEIKTPAKLSKNAKNKQAKETAKRKKQASKSNKTTMAVTMLSPKSSAKPSKPSTPTPARTSQLANPGNSLNMVTPSAPQVQVPDHLATTSMTTSTAEIYDTSSTTIEHLPLLISTREDSFPKDFEIQPYFTSSPPHHVQVSMFLRMKG
jgi:hypothetical protein